MEITLQQKMTVFLAANRALVVTLVQTKAIDVAVLEKNCQGAIDRAEAMGETAVSCFLAEIFEPLSAEIRSSRGDE